MTWISSERLPEEGYKLAIDAQMGLVIAYYHADKNRWDVEKGGILIKGANIDFWQPLPPPPLQEQASD